MPDLNSHFRRSQISPALFISRWLMTLYASYLPLDTLLPVWDCFFTSGWKVMLKIGISILRELKDKLIILELEEFATFLRKEARKQHFNYKELLQTAQSTHISTKELKKIEDQFYIAQAKIKLEAAERSHTYTEGEIEALRWAKKEFDKFDAPTKQDVATFQQKIEKLDRDLEGIHKHFITITMEVQHIENEIENLCEKKGIYVRTLKDMEKKYKKSKRRAKNLLTKLLPSRHKNLNVVGLPQALPEISVKCEAGQPENPSDCIREEDIVKCKDKLAKIEEELKLLQTMYKDKHSAYLESKNRVEEMKLKKKCYSEQLADFITMCQIKKEDTLLQLSKHLDPKKFTNLHAV